MCLQRCLFKKSSKTFLPYFSSSHLFHVLTCELITLALAEKSVTHNERTVNTQTLLHWIWHAVMFLEKNIFLIIIIVFIIKTEWCIMEVIQCSETVFSFLSHCVLSLYLFVCLLISLSICSSLCLSGWLYKRLSVCDGPRLMSVLYREVRCTQMFLFMQTGKAVICDVHF